MKNSPRVAGSMAWKACAVLIGGNVLGEFFDNETNKEPFEFE
jgi:hypothetical protein